MSENFLLNFFLEKTIQKFFNKKPKTTIIRKKRMSENIDFCFHFIKGTTSFPLYFFIRIRFKVT